MITEMNGIKFPQFTGVRCLMLPYIQGDSSSVPDEYKNGYEDILENTFINKGNIGFLTIDESVVKKGQPQRGDRSKYSRALHTEVGIRPNNKYGWGAWADDNDIRIDLNTEVLLANNTNNSCAVWDAEHKNTSHDGDIGDFASDYPYSDARFMGKGEVFKIGVFTPHESLPVNKDTKRQFLRIVSSGVRGRAKYFTENPLMM